jgi:nucleotide-binding universal stress UspA family protein
MGAHRKRILREVFVGTTIERVMRTGRHPVLMVNRPPADPYRAAVLASDLSDASAAALRTARALGFLGASELAVVHAFMPLAKDMMAYVGVEGEKISEHVAHAGADARNRLVASLQACCPELLERALLVEEGDPVEVIRGAVTRAEADLAIIGTRGHTGPEAGAARQRRGRGFAHARVRRARGGVDRIGSRSRARRGLCLPV